MTSILLTSLIISLFCCGWRIVTSEDQVLNFLKRPFDKLKEKKDAIGINKLEDFILYWSKPFIMCITCFSSFWGIIIYYAIHNAFSVNTIICCIISAFLNNVLYFGYTKFINE